jgi:hypothetical protein
VKTPEKAANQALVTAVLQRIETRMPDPDSLQGLSRVEADLMAAVTAHGVIGNGGHDFWFQGRNREHTLRAAEAFERMGEDKAANAMRPTEDYVFAHRTELADVFSPLDRVIWDVDFDAVAARYIRAKKAELSATDPDLMRAVPALWAD